MHKKLTSELTSLAHDILTFKKRDDVFALKQKAYEVYEKLAVLAYIEEYINNTPQATQTKEELIEQFEKSLERKEVTKKNVAIIKGEEKQKIENEVLVKSGVEVKKEEKVEEESTIEITLDKKCEEEVLETPVEKPFDQLQQLLFDDPEIKNEADFIEELKAPYTLEEELQDTLSVDVTANLFEKAPPKRSLNDMLQNTIQIGLNDRIAFVKHLFDGNQNDYNRVISQLNTLKTEPEAKSFIKRMVKPDYDWSNKEEYENRLMEIIERKFS